MTLHYIERGDPAHPTVLLLHGGRDHARSWDDFAATIESRFHIVALDLRGHGHSDWVSDGGYAILDHVVDLAELIDHLCIRSLLLVGHSLGGNIALRYAGLFPEAVRGLVVIEGLGPSSVCVERLRERDPLDHMADWIARRRTVQHRSLRRYGNVEDAAARVQALNPSLPVATSLHLAREGTRQDADGRLVFGFDPALVLGEALDLSWPDKHRLWQRITAPVLLVYGAESWASNPAEDGRESYFRSASTVVVPGAGHWVHLEQPAEFVRLTTPFLLANATR